MTPSLGAQIGKLASGRSPARSASRSSSSRASSSRCSCWRSSPGPATGSPRSRASRPTPTSRSSWARWSCRRRGRHDDGRDRVRQGHRVGLPRPPEAHARAGSPWCRPSSRAWRCSASPRRWWSLLVGVAAGATIEAGVGAFALVALVVLLILAFGALGLMVAIRTGGRGRPGHVLAHPGALLPVLDGHAARPHHRGLVQDDRDGQPASYPIEAARSLFISGWDAEALALGAGIEGDPLRRAHHVRRPAAQRGR